MAIKNSQEPAKLIDLLRQSATEKETEDLQFQVEQSELQLQSDISATKQSLSRKQRERKSLLTNGDISFEKLSSIDDEIEGLKLGLKRLEKYKTELF